MKISCLPVSFFKEILASRMTLQDWARIGREAGLDGIDISIMLVPDLTIEAAKKIRTGFEKEHMPLIMVTTYPDFTHPDKIQRSKELEYLKRDIVIASTMGARYLRITAGQAHPQTSREKGIEWTVDYFKKATEAARKSNVQLLFENHSKPGIWEYQDFSHPTDIFLEIFEKTLDTGIGINFDTANTLAYGDEPIYVLDKVIDRVKTIHISDIKEKGSFAPVKIGTGAVRFDKIFDVLLKRKFDDWFCIEEASFKGEKAVSSAVVFVKNEWEKRSKMMKGEV